MINNRQAGRRRGRGGNNPGGGGGGGPRQGGGRPDNGNRIDSRARGNASQLYEKYKNMASDAQRQGDRVNTEYYLQFADHYFRVLSEQRGRFEEAQPRRSRDDFDFDGDNEFGGEFGDEGERQDGGDQPAVQRFDRDDRGRSDGRNDGQGEGRQQRDDRPRGEGRDDRPRGEGRDDRPRGEGRDDRPRAEGRDERPRDDRPRAEARDDRPRGEREGARRDGNGEARPRGEWQERPRRGRPEQPQTEQARLEPVGQSTDPLPDERLATARGTSAEQPVTEVAGQRRADPMTAGETLEGRAEDVLEADRPLDAPAPRRRGRPRRDAEPVAPTGDADGAGVLEADRLPPSITLAANDEAPADAKPRRRRVRPVEETPTAAE